MELVGKVDNYMDNMSINWSSAAVSYIGAVT